MQGTLKQVSTNTGIRHSVFVNLILCEVRMELRVWTTDLTKNYHEIFELVKDRPLSIEFMIQ